MPPPDQARRRSLLWLGSAMTLLAGCGDTDSTTSTPAQQPNAAGTTEPEVLGPGPQGEEYAPVGTATIQRGTATPASRDVVFSKPGGEVSATLYGRGDCAIVLVPQADMDRQSWHQYATRFARDGFLAMAIDEGKEGKAAGVRTAIEYVRTEAGVRTVVVIGASSGGQAAVTASAEDPSAVDGVVALSPAGGTVVADQLTMPVLIVVSEGDDRRFVRTAEALADGTPGADQLVTYDGDAHGQGLFQSPHAETLRERIGSFVERVCRPGPATPASTTTP